MSGKKKGRAAVVLLVVMIIAAAALIAVLVIGPDFLGKGRYPLEYEDTISANAKEFGVDPYLVAAVINTESGFDPKAVSRVGAVGLMQIMPETGEWIAGKLGKDGFTMQDLYDPGTNIRFGCWYLGFLKDTFDGNLQLMTAGYNAGHNRVAQWLADQTVSDGQTLQNIPFPETEKYVEKIAKAYEKYREYYPDVFA